MVQLYREQQYEKRKYYLLGASDKNIDVLSIKLLQVNSQDSAVTSAAQLWKLNLFSSQSVVHIGAAIITMNTQLGEDERLKAYFYRQFAVVEDSDFDDVELIWAAQIMLYNDTSEA